MNPISQYKGLILITFIILAILYFSPDLECMLLFSGILVNIVTICLNTGALKINTGNNRSKESLINPEPEDASGFEAFGDKPNFTNLAKADELLADLPPSPEDNEKPRYCGAKEDMTVTRLELQPMPPIDKSYKGAIDFEESDEPIQIGADRVALVSNAHQGINARRQMAGAYNKRRLVYPAVARELEESASKAWWGAYDEVTVIEPKTTPY